MTGMRTDPPSWSVVAAGVLVIVSTGGLAGCLDGGGDGNGGGGVGSGSGSDGSGTPAEWPHHGFDAGNSAAYGSPGGGQGDVLWENTSTGTQSPPAFADGLAYIGEEDGLSAWNPDTGEQVWWFEDNATLDDVDEGRSRTLLTPVVADGTVYASSTLTNEPGRVLAIDADTAEEAWRAELDYALRAPPTVGDGLVYVGTERIAGSGYAEVLALDTDTGEEAWSFTVGENPHVYGSPVVSDGSVIFGTTGGVAPQGTGDYVYKLDAETGDEEWSVEFPGTSSSVAVHEGTVYVEARGQVLALDEATGDEAWVHEDLGGTSDTPAVVDGRVYIPDSAEDRLVALDAGSGEELWAFDGGLAQPAVAGDTVFTISVDEAGNATVHALDASTGDERWGTLLGPVDEVSDPAFAGGTLVVTQDDWPEATFFALDA